MTASIADRPIRLRFRNAFLGTVAAGALSLAFGGAALAAPDACTPSGGGTIETCSGNQSAGIASGTDFTAPPVTTLNVNNLTQAIAPASGTRGISFTSAGAITITSDTGTFGITTAGLNTDGILANSLGITGAVTVTSTGNITATGLGITAQADGGAVTVTSTGNIAATGTNEDGILSVSGAVAGAVTVSSTGNINAASVGIEGQSVGGGAVTVTSTGAITAGALGIFARTEFSGSGDITVTSTGNITTAGGFGIYATSTNNLGAVTVTSTGNIATNGSLGFGIFAHNNSNAAVTVTSTGNIATAGDNAFGIMAGSGGLGAVTVASTGNIATTGSGAIGIFASPSGGSVAVTSAGNITTGGDNAAGILVISNGNGAVAVTSSGNIATAGFGAYGIKTFGGGAVTVSSTGNITTAGGDGSGILVTQGNNDTGAVTVTSTGDIATTGIQGHGILVSQANNDTGAVTVTSTGNITTTRDGADGIRVLQVSTDTGAMTVTSAGNIATAGNGTAGISAHGYGAITVTSTGNISTAAGATTRGIEAFSNGAGAVSVTSIGNVTGQGSGMIAISSVGNNAVTLTSTGNITVSGDNSTGLEAFGQGSSGAVTLTSTGNVSATGNGSNAILGQSNGGPIAITITSGTVTGGTGTEPNGGAGVFIASGTNNTLTNMGTVMAVSGLAIAGDTGNNTVNNSGTVIGNVTLGTGANAFNNMAGGLFNAGAAVDLGAGNTLTNAGTLSPGGAGVIQTTMLTGNLVQGASGKLLTDFNIAGNTADRINISGTANLAGAVQLQVQNLTFGAFQQTILSAAGGTTNNGLSLLASPVLQAQLVFPNATDVVVTSPGLSFALPGLNANQTALGNALNAAGQSGGLGGPIFNLLLNIPSIPAYGAALTQLSGEAATGTQQTTFDAMNIFMGTMLDPFNRGTTSTPGGGASGYASEGDASAYAADGRKRASAERDAYAMFTKAPLAKTWDPHWSVWAAGFGGSQTTDGNAATGSNSVTSGLFGVAVGADYIFSPRTVAGFALAGGGTSFSLANNLGGGRSDLFQAGAFVRHTVGQAYISGALAYGWQDITTDRIVTLAGIDHLHAEFNANAFSGRIEGGYRFVAPWIGGFGITPYAAAQFTTFDLPAYAERAIIGTNNFALAYGAKSVTDPRSELGIRTDKSFAMADGVLTLRGRLAWAHDYDPDRSIGATFQSLPGASFVVNGAAQASDSALVTAAVEKRWLSGWSAAASFEGEFSDVTRSYAGKGVVRYQW